MLRQQGVGLLSELTHVISPLTIHYLPVCNYVINSFSSHLTGVFVYHDSCLVPIDTFGAFSTKIVLSILLGPGWSVVLEITSSIMSFSAKCLCVVLIGLISQRSKFEFLWVLSVHLQCLFFFFLTMFIVEQLSPCNN